MSNMQCHSCQRSINARSAVICPECNGYICDACAQEHQGRCNDCDSKFSQDI